MVGNLGNVGLMVDIRPRSEKHAQVLRDEWAEAEKGGIDFSEIQFDKLVVQDEDYELAY